MTLPRVRRPCDECPWLKTAEPGRFTAERWASLLESSHDPDKGSALLGAPLFACHKTAEGRDRACAGWLAVEGSGHVSIRLAVLDGRLPAEALEPGAGWPPLFETVREAAAHDLGHEVESARASGNR